MTEKNKKVVQITRRGLMVWCALGLFIAGWMFVLGILVGRGTAPVSLDAGRLEQELAELKASILAKQQAEIEAQASGDTKNKPELGFYEALKKESATEKQLKIQPQREKPRAKRRPSPVVPRKAEAPKKPATPIPAAEIQPAPVAKKTNDADTETRPAKGRLTIQVAALKEANGADQLVDRLRKKGYPAYQIQTTTEDKRTWYRVRVGAYADKGAAQRMLENLKKDKLTGLIVQTQ